MAKKSVKKNAKEELTFPGVVCAFKDADFLDEEPVMVYDKLEDINGLLPRNKKTLVAIYELVGFEYRTKQDVVDIEEHPGK